MRNRLPFLSGLALATLGVSGLAGGGLLWNFQGRTLGLGSTITALVLLGISFVLLRPEPRLPVEVPWASRSNSAPQASFLGLMLQSSPSAWRVRLWFSGLALDSSHPVGRRCSFAESGFQPSAPQGQNISQDRAGGDHEAVSESAVPAQTTAEAIAELLAAEQQQPQS